ncbi:hypothetical protein P4388_00170 [Bacillus thuringiensis]|uniref:Uncharacterized protein n=3 Tax=Bacillus cereus group TaxID=86661 RepID=A0A9X6UIZ5_BACCE|nr:MULTISPECIES: hypothetical protein [Bacillus]WIV93535.1 hypothetical protein QNH49_03065 [Bacillus bombysepticus]EEM98100.1 hypothetical protein bthur0013_4880 [Bacillus thuringiensis IBL 200]KAB2375012.1 hypothetical protein F8510_16490 [Bacillus sp. RM2(2019)]KXH78873.1 hypothetical protein AU379_25245 [Bacillus sp. JH7]KXY58778.1 hypothetical protein AT261_17425 [Bacillus cereus]
MTQRYFLAAKKRLPIGIFGRKETKRVERDKAFLGSELDFAAIVVREIKKTEIPSHLRNPFCVSITPEGGQFKNGCETNLKCLQLLFNYIQDMKDELFTLEFYTAWYGEENNPVSNYSELNFKDLVSPLQLILADREYVLLTKKDW